MMPNNSENQKDYSKSVTLKPSHRLPLLITFLGLASIPIPLNNIVGILICAFGLFLLLQSFILRLEFTPTDMVVWQLGRELRRFPFKNWLAWRLLLPSLPGLLYFREEASPHLLPILFNPQTLRDQLELRVGNLEKPKVSSQSSSELG